MHTYLMFHERYLWEWKFYLRRVSVHGVSAYRVQKMRRATRLNRNTVHAAPKHYGHQVSIGLDVEQHAECSKHFFTREVF